jgi:predicted nucleic acid-binding protein
MAHGNGLSMADAIILTSLIHAGAEVVYTTDRDLARYGAGPEIVLL